MKVEIKLLLDKQLLHPMSFPGGSRQRKGSEDRHEVSTRNAPPRWDSWNAEILNIRLKCPETEVVSDRNVIIGRWN